MPLTPMRFKDYVWPHNPRTYSITYRREVASDKVPFQHYHMQDLGLDYRVFSGEGEFAGSGAYDEFRKLATVFYSPGPGTLVHPVWQPALAHFVALELLQEPRSDYISYRFEFWEDTARHTPGVYAADLTSTDDDTASSNTDSSSTDSTSTGSTAGSSSNSGASSTATATSTPKTHTVRTGETLASIAAANNTTTAAIIRVNPSVRPAGGLVSGTILRLE